MNVFQGIWRDLIDKRLWPIAVALLLFIVAVPVVLARSGGAPAEGASAAPLAGADSPEGLRPAVIVAADPGGAPSRGSLRNPFLNPGTGGPRTSGDPAGAKTGAAVASAGMPDGAGDTGAGKTTPSSGGDAGGNTTGDGEGAGGTTKKQSTGSGESGYDVSLRFGTDGSMKSFKAVPRLTPLPSAETPSFVYLGVLSGGKTAVFMIAAEVTAVGDGTCRPSASKCETLEMKKGETMFLDVTGADGKTKQYQLDVTRITKIGKGGETISAQEAAGSDPEPSAASAIEAGREAVKSARRAGAADTLDRYRFVRSRGVVVRRLSRELRRTRVRAAAGSPGELRVRQAGPVVAAGL